MKKLIPVFLMAFLIIPDSELTAQDVESKKNIFGINPLGLLLNIYSGHYSKVINDGDAEINIPFFFWNEPFGTDDLSLIGLGGKYRIYKDGGNKGVFYGGGFSVFIISWDFTPLFSTAEENISATTYTPKVEVGYRINWDNGFTLAPNLDLGFTAGTVEASDGTEADFGSSGISWGIGFGAGWKF